MARNNAMTMKFENVGLLGTSMLFTDFRIDRRTVPCGFYIYEIRHTDDDWSMPCQLAHGIMVNFFGTVITNEPIQLPADGLLDFPTKDYPINFCGTTSTLAEYAERYPPTGKDIMRFTTSEPENYNLYFSQSNVKDKDNGCIGYLRGDFGNGEQFFTTWFSHQDQLNTQSFKQDLDRVINWLRQDYSPLKDFKAMKMFCKCREQKAQILIVHLPVYGFRIETNNYQYMLRCAPTNGDFYIYCYDKNEQNKENKRSEQERKRRCR